MQVTKHLFDHPYLSKVIDDKSSWFMHMEVPDLINTQFFFNTNSLEQQPTTSQFFQLFTPQTFAHVATAIHCVMSQYATGKKVSAMFSHDAY